MVKRITKNENNFGARCVKKILQEIKINANFGITNSGGNVRNM